MDEIGVLELKAKLSLVLRRVSRGERVRVTMLGEPLADIVLAERARSDDALRALIADGRLTRPERPRPAQAPPLARVDGSASELVLAERDAVR